ncbi:Uncharacterised protein [Mycolicibacterium phlei]|uniref:hypothetical protein n=1 Tax=Mycobacteroides chelonae TaxID=1774 RepID=UPI000618C39B|nr:hypothetical protein [Mycobacteroides chelonae]VEG16008.1 Uncharacterised protein [Mycolicibacterium phlei]AKC38651.1 hypothetical protein GR01_08835 [Mycobacteroides chelonae]ANB00890.1 hypothetical protein BB28_09340 [Mycobacteroides chelonae CCUG 47445]OLT78136.1 hypothetical protein BKG56_14285 [Mycobacteroides chelonae]ORV15080.1 hypothetical protein AWB96_11250 [Mycobacteroides chelonae]
MNTTCAYRISCSIEQWGDDLTEEGADCVLLERAIEIVKVETLLPISDGLELVCEHLQNHGPTPEFSTG